MRWSRRAPRRWEVRLYLGARTALFYEVVISAAGTEQRHYVYANGTAIAQHSINPSGTSSTRYFYRDHLGSVTLIADESGSVTERLSYDANGKRRFASGADDPSNTLVGSATDLGFTGHEQLEENGLIHMNGRLYDPRIARFVSADPTAPSRVSGQALNRYAYVLNNPFVYVDPTGFVPGSICNANPMCEVITFPWTDQSGKGNDDDSKPRPPRRRSTDPVPDPVVTVEYGPNTNCKGGPGVTCTDTEQIILTGPRPQEIPFFIGFNIIREETFDARDTTLRRRGCATPARAINPTLRGANNPGYTIGGAGLAGVVTGTAIGTGVGLAETRHEIAIARGFAGAVGALSHSSHIGMVGMVIGGELGVVGGVLAVALENIPCPNFERGY